MRLFDDFEVHLMASPRLAIRWVLHALAIICVPIIATMGEVVIASLSHAPLIDSMPVSRQMDMSNFEMVDADVESIRGA